MLLIVCPLVFLANFVDSIAGGGGLISLPAFLLTGIPAHSAFACNKFSASLGSIVSAIRYYKNGKIHVRAAALSAVLALVGSYIGTNINLLIGGDMLKKIVVVVLPVVAALVLFGGKRKRRKTLLAGKLLYPVCALIGFFIGMYDGLIGPGTGTFMILGYTSIAGFDYVTASGNAKVANLASNAASAAVYLFAGQVNFALALPAALCCMAGGWLGSGCAIKNGAKLVKMIMVVVLIGIFIKLIYDLGIFG